MGFTIYMLLNSHNGKRYVGQTCKSVEHRIRRHLKSVREGKRYAISEALRKYGAGSFRVVTIEKCDTKARADALEARWIRLCDSRTAGHGYNLTEGGDGTQGHRHTPEARAKMAGRKVSPDGLARMSAAQKNRSLETRTRMSIAQDGKVASPTARANMSAAHSTPEAIAMVSARMKGRSPSAETRARISAAGVGRRPSEMSLAKMSESMRAAIARRSPEQRDEIVRKYRETCAARKRL